MKSNDFYLCGWEYFYDPFMFCWAVREEGVRDFDRTIFVSTQEEAEQYIYDRVKGIEND